eukprot:gene23830-26966_t
MLTSVTSLEIEDRPTVEQIQVDAFADVPFSGNPAAVIFEHREDLWMQNIAIENNVAATVFLSLLPHALHTYKIRWFTPAKEIELCGHGTLAAAHALYETRRVPLLQPIQFETVYGGSLTAQGRSDGNIELCFPLAQVHALPDISLERIQSLATALSVSDDEILFVGTSNSKLLVEITRAAFARLATKTINFGLIAEQGGSGVLVTARGGARAEALDVISLSLDSLSVGVRAPRADIVNDERFDFVSRCFLVQYEDPVTGSAHCSLAPYWASKLLTSEEQEQSKTLVAYQASARGGVLQLN